MKNYKFLFLIIFLFALKKPYAQQGVVDKKPDNALLKSLYAKTGQIVYRGEQLKTIGMPIGGIAAGTLYIRGDGTLAQWWIANNAYNTGAGGNSPLITPFGPMPMNYNTFRPESFIDQGFKIKIESNGKTFEKELNKNGFDDISFIGEYPIAMVKYEDKKQKLPVDVSMKAFSPFIPLDAKESATPGTYLIFEIKNTSAANVRVDLSGWLQNPVCISLQNEITGNSRNIAIAGKEMQSLVMDMVPEKEMPIQENVFDDFEDGTYRNWTITGNAFSNHPATGQLPNQQILSGMSGSYFINSFTKGGDKDTGKMVSKDFIINENYINALVGGGNHPGKTAFELIVDGKPLFSATGNNSETLEQVSWDVKKLKGKNAHFEIIDNSTGGWGHILVDRITFSDLPLKRISDVKSHPYFGNITLSVLDKNAVVITNKDVMASSPSEKKLGDKLVGEIETSFELPPGAKKQVVFMLTWYFPNRPLHYGGGVNWGKPIPTEGPAIGNMYANWFSSSLDVAHWLQANMKRLTEVTYRFHKSYYENANIPYWLRNRIMMPVSTLATETAQWWATDKFWAWEGVGSCPGTCTHVWNYEQALAHLFPGLEKNIRERTDFTTSLTPDGGVLTRNGTGGVRIDGHVGTILKAYREYLNSDNDFFLTRNWQVIKKIMEYAIAQDAEDGHADGLMTNKQPNTYDVDFYGANTFVGSLYLASLKACSLMASQMHDPVFADSCLAIFKSGSKLSEKLFNGKYFIQDVNLKTHPEFQYADGCLSDQLFGQTWAHLLNLGYIYPEDMVKKSLQSIWNYNWKSDVGEYNQTHTPERIFARPGDPGLINCTWPLGKYQGSNAMPYKSEVWTGVEDEVATNMIYDGMIDQGLSIIKGIDDRYSPGKHNPWNEIECGDHYARALASWGVLLALEDFKYNGTESTLSFAPKIQPDNFNGFYTTARSWGNLIQKRSGNTQTNEIRVAYGELHLSTLNLKVTKGKNIKNVSVTINGKSSHVKWKIQNDKLIIFGMDKWLNEGDNLKAVII